MNHQREPDLFTALHLACAGGLVDAVRALIKGGADVDAVATEDVMPIHCAESCTSAAQKKEILSMLRAKDAKRSVAEVLAALRAARGGGRGGQAKSSVAGSSGRRKILVSTSHPSSSTTEAAQEQSKARSSRPVVTTVLSGFSGSVGMRGKLVKESKTVVAKKKKVAARELSATEVHFSLGGGGGGGGGRTSSVSGGGIGSSSSSSSSTATSTTTSSNSLIDRVVLNRPAGSRKYATTGVDAH